MIGRLISTTVVTLSLLGCAFSTYTFLQPAPGQIAFGTDVDGTNFRVINPITAADQGARIGVVGVLARPVTGTVLVEVQRGQETFRNPNGFTFDPTPGDRIGFHLSLSLLHGPGHYVVRMMLGSEVLATGELEVTGPAKSS